VRLSLDPLSALVSATYLSKPAFVSRRKVGVVQMYTGHSDDTLLQELPQYLTNSMMYFSTEKLTVAQLLINKFRTSM
jgi:hypothetical protein